MRIVYCMGICCELKKCLTGHAHGLQRNSCVIGYIYIYIHVVVRRPRFPPCHGILEFLSNSFIILHFTTTSTTPQGRRRGGGSPGRNHINRHIYICIYTQLFYSSTLYFKLLCSALLCSALLCSAPLYSSPPGSSPVHSTPLHSTLHCATRRCAVPRRAALVGSGLLHPGDGLCKNPPEKLGTCGRLTVPTLSRSGNRLRALSPPSVIGYLPTSQLCLKRDVTGCHGMSGLFIKIERQHISTLGSACNTSKSN